MSFQPNEEYLASQREDFEQSIAEGDWDMARAIIEDLSEKHIDTSKLEDMLNDAQKEAEDWFKTEQEKWDNLQRENDYYRNIY